MKILGFPLKSHHVNEQVLIGKGGFGAQVMPGRVQNVELMGAERNYLPPITAFGPDVSPANIDRNTASKVVTVFDQFGNRPAQIGAYSMLNRPIEVRQVV